MIRVLRTHSAEARESARSGPWSRFPDFRTLPHSVTSFVDKIRLHRWPKVQIMPGFEIMLSDMAFVLLCWWMDGVDLDAFFAK